MRFPSVYVGMGLVTYHMYFCNISLPINKSHHRLLHAFGEYIEGPSLVSTQSFITTRPVASNLKYNIVNYKDRLDHPFD